MRILIVAIIWFCTATACTQAISPPGSGPLKPPTAAGAYMDGVKLPPRPDKALNRPTNEALDNPIDKLSENGMALRQVLERFSKDVHVSMKINWDALQTVKIGAEAPVTMELTGVPARQALHAILSSVSPDIDFIVDNNQVVVSTKQDLQSSGYQQVLVYDLRPLFADWDPDSPQAGKAADSLVSYIQVAVDYDSWRDSGGTVGTARIINGQLIVNQTLENHDRIAGLLREVAADPPRATRSYDVRDLVKDDPAKKVAELMAAIEANCGRDTWRDQQGTTSSMAYFDGKLLVTTNLVVHEQMTRLLALMRQ